MSDTIKKNGLIYADNMHTLIGVDTTSDEFKGRVPFGPKTVADEAFNGTTLETISLPDSVKQVGFNVFENAVNLKSVKLPSALSELTTNMFANCANLEKVNMPTVTTEFPEGIFLNCKKLAEPPFRTDIAFIGDKVFAGCDGFINLVIPDTVQSIGAMAFGSCHGLESVVIGAGVQEIADDAFEDCLAIHHVRISDYNQYFYVGEDGSLYRKSDNQVVINIHALEQEGVSFIKPTDSALETQQQSNDPIWIDSDDDETEEDDTFSPEIGAGNEEIVSMGAEDVVPSEPVVESEMEVESEIETPIVEEPIVETPVVEPEPEVVSETPVVEPAPTVEAVTEPEPEVEIETPIVETPVMETPEVTVAEETVVETVAPEPEIEVPVMETNPVIETEISADSENKFMSSGSDNLTLATEQKEDIIESSEETNMLDQEPQMDDMLSDIRNQNISVREDIEPSKVAIDESEYSNIINTMNEVNGTYTQEVYEAKKLEKNLGILCDSVQFSNIEDVQTSGEPLLLPDLYVIAENLALGGFSTKLIKCAQTIAHIHDLKRIIYLSGLPVDNDEFMMFFSNLIKRQHAIFACEAESPKSLSAYGKKVCEVAEISLEKDSIIEQRKQASIKSANIIKLVVQDILN